jgi:hypothetical protein
LLDTSLYFSYWCVHISVNSSWKPHALHSARGVKTVIHHLNVSLKTLISAAIIQVVVFHLGSSVLRSLQMRDCSYICCYFSVNFLNIIRFKTLALTI